MTALRRVVLVDDNDHQRSLLETELRSRGWSVEVARTGAQGLEVAARVSPDVVVTELILPDVRGFDYARSLRNATYAEMFIIALTRAPKQLHARALMAGFDHVQIKPFDVDELHHRMLGMTITWPRTG